MPTRVILNDDVVFDAQANTLTVISDKQRVIKLNHPVSRCLQILLDRFPATVPQGDFFSFIWGGDASKIPTNALYQNISLLRRSLKNASDGLSEIVITVPRIGFRLSSELKIRSQVISDQLSAINEPAKQSGADTVANGFTVTNKTARIKQKLAVSLGIPLVFIFVFIAINIFLKWPYDESDVLFETYTVATEHGGCRIFTYPDFAQNNIAELNGYLNKYNIVCTFLTNVYLSVNTARTRVSVMYCDKPVLQAQTCVTHIYWNDK
jgi:DNA-binding winged helix-turn-helix (wHTH) protein